MLRLFRNRRGQNTAEYAILIGIIVAAVLALQTYVKRGLQGRLKDEVDNVGEATIEGVANPLYPGSQYEPEYLESTYTTTTTKDRRTVSGTAKAPSRSYSTSVTQSGSQTTLAPESEPTNPIEPGGPPISDELNQPD